MAFEGSDLRKLAELLKPPEDDPAPEPPPKVKTSPYNRLPKDLPRSLEEFEAQQLEESTKIFDQRKRPTYDIKYAQSVSAEDVFLQMGPKTPSSASCESLSLIVDLPGEKSTAIDLNLTYNNVSISGLNHRLDLDLPHRIDPNKSNAEWNSRTEQLILTLRLVREFDFMNF